MNLFGDPLRRIDKDLAGVFERRAELSGYAITFEAPMLRHFTARFAPRPDRSTPGAS